uniref:Fringe 1 n=1 Tax=Phallusia mammillata TaxID=59560 RepID=A0A6F9DQT3_9ASCI|nr:Fringe 1 [Phallusia mammillata]
MANSRHPPYCTKRLCRGVWLAAVTTLTLFYLVIINCTNFAPSYRHLTKISLSSTPAIPKYRRVNETKSLSAAAKHGVEDALLQDIFISVKTSEKFHGSRLKIIIDTWFDLVPEQTYFFSDATDEKLQERTKGHVINTGCGKEHTRTDLTCKMAAEYDMFVSSSEKWWCHFDDDNYVNVKQLNVLLKEFNPEENVYIGKPSMSRQISTLYSDENVKFSFATGGAGMCISRSLAMKMSPWCRRGSLLETSDKLRFPDDCTIGFVITNRLGVNLTHSPLFHSHLEPLSRIPSDDLKKQVTLSYQTSSSGSNIINFKHWKLFNSSFDPTRLYSFHCSRYPTTHFCT